MIINIINRISREDRRVEVTKQMEMEKCAYTFWPGIEGKIPKINIHAAHKQIVKHAKEQEISSICIAEDDLVWSGSGAWKYFLDNQPKDADAYVGSYYSGSHDENFVVKGLCGLTLYIIYAKAYDLFLSLPEHRHIDSAFGNSGAKIIVSPLFVCRQSSGYSDQRKRFCDDSKRLKNKNMYNGE